LSGSETHYPQLCYAHAVANYRRNFICGGSFFFTANLAERRLRLLVDDIDAADNRSRFGERRWVSLPLNPSYGLTP
jgi:hypothetical protein